MDDQISSASTSLSQYHSRLLSRDVDILALNRELVSEVEFFKSAINRSSNPEMKTLNQSNFLDAIFEVFQVNEESPTLENLKNVNQKDSDPHPCQNGPGNPMLYNQCIRCIEHDLSKIIWMADIFEETFANKPSVIFK